MNVKIWRVHALFTDGGNKWAFSAEPIQLSSILGKSYASTFCQRAVLKLLTAFAILLTVITLAGNERHAVDAAPLVSDLRISQVYGGGGNSGATYTHDFIELFNAGTTSISLTGYSVQYASSSGTSWSATVLSGRLVPVNAFNPGSGWIRRHNALPTPDVIGTIAMSGASGKVALASNTTALSGSLPKRWRTCRLRGIRQCELL